MRPSLDSWYGFAGEVVVIVLGVLIALSAEEFVQRLNWETEVKQARTTLDVQLNDAHYNPLQRIRDRVCTERKLNRLDQLIADDSVPPVNLSGLSSLRVWPISAWDAATASGAVSHMEPEVRDLYSSLFAFTNLLNELNQREFEAIADLKSLERHRKLTETSRDRLSRDISRLRSYNSMIALGAEQWLETAKPLRLQLSPAALDELRKPRVCLMPGEPPGP